MNLFASIIFLLVATKLTILEALHDGDRAWLANARFIASIRLRHMEEERLGSGFLCTATLINNYHVVTAATCVTHFLSSQLQVVLGNVNLNERTSLAIYRNVRRMHFHPDFERNSETSEFYGNMAVIQMTISVREPSSGWAWIQKGTNRNFHIQPIRTSKILPNEMSRCAFFAWGRQQSTDTERNSNLLMANLPLINNNDDALCRSSSTVFCAGAVNNGSSSSDGSATLCNNLGGSMICENTFFGIAITNSCNGPGHLLSIAANRDWILVASSSNNIFVSNLMLIMLIILVT